MTFLLEIELQEKGNRFGLVSRGVSGLPNYLAFVFVNRDRRYFIATAKSLATGAAISRYRWRQVLHIDSNKEPERQGIEIPQPEAAEVYYSCCARVDQHNRDRCDTLGLERKFETNNWSMRVNMTIFGMTLVYSWRVHSRLTFNVDEEGKQIRRETQKQYYGRLSTDLIDNKEDTTTTRERVGNVGVASMPAIERTTGRPTSGIGARLTPTNKGEN
jgi:hypothetical protein